ncbi:MAG: hypothetical protein M0024_11270 [Nitrospiraceae bacterium]|nr:hypothetical protein [Nitrospiraceae bacterium]
MDRDRSTFRKITFLSPERAVAIVDESWFIVLQNYTTRRQISGRKADFVTVRYFLKKMWGRWIIVDYEVYPQGEVPAPLPADRLFSW